MTKKVVLVTPPSHSHRTAEENLGIGYIAAALRSVGYEVKIVDGWLRRLNILQIASAVAEAGQIDLVGISCYRYSLEDVREIISNCRSQKVTAPVVVGGYGPTFHDEEFLRAGANFAVRGEGESVILNLLHHLEKGSGVIEVHGLSYLDQDGGLVRNSKLTAHSNLDLLTFPARDTLVDALKLKNPVHISTSRGCEAHCLFCSIVSFERQMGGRTQWRQRSVESVVNEIEVLQRMYGARCFKIVDDSFIEPPRDARWARQFCRELQRRGLDIRFRTQIRADRIEPELARALVAAGWFATSVGIENGSPTALKRMGKQASYEQNLRALEILAGLGVYVQMGMIIFDRQTTAEELRENYQFLASQPWAVTKGIFTEMYASEGTPFTRLLQRDGVALPKADGGYWYPIADPFVRSVYAALKEWHKSHSVVYDHAINPIGAPKDLPHYGLASYHKISRRLYDLDVEMFGRVLSLPSHVSIEQALQFTSDQIAWHSQEYQDINLTLGQLDNQFGIAYEADPNPFL